MSLFYQVTVKCEVTGYPKPEVGIWMRNEDPEAGFHSQDREEYYKNTPSLENNVNAVVNHPVTPDNARYQTVEATVHLPDYAIREQDFICYATNHLTIYGEYDILDMQWQDFTKRTKM